MESGFILPAIIAILTVTGGGTAFFFWRKKKKKKKLPPPPKVRILPSIKEQYQKVEKQQPKRQLSKPPAQKETRKNLEDKKVSPKIPQTFTPPSMKPPLSPSIQSKTSISHHQTNRLADQKILKTKSSQQLSSKTVQNANFYRGLKSILTVTAIIATTAGIIFSIYIFKIPQKVQQRAQKFTDTKTSVNRIQQCPVLNLYKVEDEIWEKLTDKDLQEYPSNSTIRIAVLTSQQFNKARFRIKLEDLPFSEYLETDSFRKYPENQKQREFFIDYLLPEGYTNFTIETELFDGARWK